MDEPLSNLDAKLRVQTRTQIAALQRRLAVTTVYVTHDQVEAMTMGDRVAVLDRGVLLQCDTPRALFAAPVNLFVAGFIGSPAMNLFPATVTDAGATFASLVVPLTPDQRSELTSDKVRIGVRPDGWVLGSAESTDSGLQATVEVVEELGTEAFVYGTTDDDTPIVTKTEGMTTIDRGDMISLTPRTESVHLFDEVTGARLTAA
jgi:multiple sugar transport system ATP-binding protein